MAKSKKLKGFTNPEPSYYAYYDKSTGDLISVTNEKSTTHDHGIEITETEYTRLVTGQESFSRYKVGYAKNTEGKTELSLVPVTDLGYAFRSNMFEWITDEPTSDTELVVTWNGKEKQWNFSLSKDCKDKFTSELAPSRLIFFVTLLTDFDFLIRTITIPTNDLLGQDTVTVKFDTQLENKINNISIATKLLFNTYGLKVHE